MCGAVQANGPEVTTFTYDQGDHVTTVTDPRGLATGYTRDGLGQLWQQVSPDTGTTRYAYDVYGRRASMIRADGNQATYGFDGLNRMTSITAEGSVQHFTYDACTNGLGRLCSDGDATGATSYSYTPEGWIAGRGFSVGASTYALGYTYDSVGHISTVNYPDGNQAHYVYTNGVVSNLTLTVAGNAVASASAIAYRPMDRGMSRWVSSDGATHNIAYDTDGRVTSIRSPGTQGLALTYDTADRITRITNAIDASLTQSFTYDEQSRVASVASPADNESFQYDANGNRLVQSGTFNTISPTSNQLMSYGSNQYGYDARGNTTSVNGALRYHFDAFNRMDSAGGMSYYVSPEGQRLRKTGAVGTTLFAPDQSGALLAEHVGGNWVDYVWLNGQLIGRIGAGQVSAIYTDQVGRPEVVTDAHRAIIWRAQNFAFGQTVVAGTITLNLGFPGQYYDAETGLWNNGFRDYNSGLGRYVESDPIGLGGGMNPYAYVGNNPLMYTDPYGLWAWGDPVPQWLVDYSAGLGDGASLGLTSLVRDAMGTDDQVDECATAYKAGGWSSFAVGAGRIAYAGLAKAGAEVAASGILISAEVQLVERA